MQPGPTLKDRILNNIDVDDSDCWNWQLFKDKDGYGQITLPGRLMRRAHRISYSVFVGEFDDSLQIDHLCRNRSCVNPKHLEPVTCAENIRRGETGKIHKDKTHCPQGHPYSGDNLLIEKKGSRKCKTCTYARTSLRKKLKRLMNPKKHYSQVLKERTHCKHGHEFSQENTWIEKNGTRHCKACHRERELKRYHAKKLTLGVA